MEQTIKTLIIVPAFNEAENIADVLADLRSLSFSFEIIVVDDGSVDETAEIAAGNNVPVLHLPFNLGIGGAMQAGYRFARDNGFDIAVQFDGDGQHRADQLEVLLEGMKKSDVDLIIGSRFMEKRRYPQGAARMVGGRILAVVLSLLTGGRITDPTSGFRAAGPEAIRYFAAGYPDDYPEPEVVLLLKKAGMACKEVPVLMSPRTGGKSSITPLRSVYYMVKVILALMVDLVRFVDCKNKKA